MNNYNDIICNPLNDRNKRFLLGKKGVNEMMAIGLNPSTASEKKLDPTSRNIQKIARNNDCDGWWLVNLYPIRTSKPNNLPVKPNLMLTKKNLEFISNLLKNPQFKITKVLCCWGNHIENHLYLKQQALKILEFIREKNLNVYCIGKTKSGNPFHPSPLSVNNHLGGINGLVILKY